ncbi:MULTISPECIES: bacteriocin immunity protein [Pseudomonas]|uniref:Bacteriocin immunity protein n=1 Tax=Pseudomonas lundensis TaxID=86185 RepID=A0ABX4GNS7_9PSED|nr:bacteriocin immunity protein [Pseudomonas lundensis]AOZ14432.1 bacteriocin immunity protein [Pseudomonas lundensis]NLU02659.1 bacteriocin immunity protein [Pseudomonas lundensis]NMZ52807.1 bacteriocin immunity protein [Pseudomonas lundensis]NNA01676.1 bacteriocin immunity protein [Pseudomonas lundensis]NNA15198.1 bacteriocin immunity protein [Pseudomonas lundensis]
MKKSISDYTEAQFIRFMEELFAANDNGASDEVLGEFLDQFRIITEHPDGTDLIYYPENGADDSAEGITETVKKWREANGLPGFKASR